MVDDFEWPLNRFLVPVSCVIHTYTDGSLLFPKQLSLFGFTICVRVLALHPGDERQKDWDVHNSLQQPKRVYSAFAAKETIAGRWKERKSKVCRTNEIKMGGLDEWIPLGRTWGERWGHEMVDGKKRDGLDPKAFSLFPLSLPPPRSPSNSQAATEGAELRNEGSEP